MSDPKTDPAPQPAADAAPAYRPVAPLAVTALAVAGLFALVVAIIGVTALVSRKPVFIPAVLLLGVLGLGLAIGARMQIRRSEGTRAGLGLANTAWWLSVVFLFVIYGPYILVTDYVIKQQSLGFTDSWLEGLAKPPASEGDETGLFTAFVKTLDTAQQSDRTINPRDKEGLEARFGPMLAAFRQNELVRLAQRSRGELRVESQAVADWTYDKNSYQVAQTLTVRTPEGVFDTGLAVFASDDKQGNRVWRIQPPGPNNGVRRRGFTGLGRALEELRFNGGRVTQQWLVEMHQGRFEEAALAMRPAEDRDRLRRLAAARDVTALGLAPLGAPGFPTGALLFTPALADRAVPGLGLEGFLSGADWVKPDPSSGLTLSREMMTVLMAPGGIMPAVSPFGPDQPLVLSEGPAGLTLQFPCNLGIPLPAGVQQRSRPKGQLIFTLADPDVLDRLKQLHAQGLDAPLVPDDAPVTLRDRKLGWRLSRLDVTVEQAPQGVGGP
jgi:hypothetical protein